MINQVEQLEMKTVTKRNTLSNPPVGKIIVVDDEPELKNILVEALAGQGFEVIGCSSGEQALEELREKEFDLLLTDLMMPEMDGIALVEAALKIDQHLIPIVMTGQGTIQTAVDAMKLGAFDYFLKPFRLQTVMPVLTRAINTRRLRMENLQLRETVAIYSLCQTIAFTLDSQTVLSRLADAALQQSDADEVSILLPTSEGTELYVAAVRGEKRERLLGERIPLQESISSWVARERTPLILDGEVHDERFVALWPRPEIRSAVSVPMQVANKLVGIINLNVTSRLRPFTLGQMKALSILASTAAAALESASLYTQVQQAEKNYRSIFENAVEGIFQSTPEGRFLTVNPSMARILGYESPNELIAKVIDVTHQVYVDPEARTKAAQIQEERGILQGFEFEAYRADGKKIWLSLNRRSVRDENGLELYREGSIEDISERKRADEEEDKLNAEIENQRQRLDDIVGSVPGVVWEAWGVPDAANQRIDFVSDYVESMLGYGVDEWVSKPNFWLSIVHPDDKERAGQLAAEAFANGKSATMDFRWLAKDGREVWVESNFVTVMDEKGQPVGMRGVNTNIGERKRAEEALKQSESQLAEAQRLAHIGSWNWDLLQNVLTWSDQHYRIFGVEPGDINVGYDEVVFDFIHPEDRQLVRDVVAKSIDSGEPFNFYYRIVRRDGEERIIQSTGSIETNERGQPIRIFGTAQDVTERRRIEQELRQSEERYRDLVENAQDIIYSHDLQGNYTSSNRAGEEITGYTQAEALRLNLEETIAPECLDKAREMLARKLASEKITAYELELIAKDGHRVPVEVNTRLILQDGVPVGVTGIARDITERKAAEAELRRLAAAVEETADSIVITDKEGNIQYVNPAFERISGYAKEEVLNQNPRFLKSGKTEPAIYKELWETIARGEVWAGHLTNRRKDGSFFEERVTISAVCDESNEIVNYVAVKQDITDFVRLEGQLRQSQKLEAIGQLAGGVAHDFNNLLTVIGGYSSILLGKMPPDSPHRSSIEEIKKAGDRASSLTRQLLAFSRKQILQPKVLDLNLVVTDLEKMVRRLIGEDIDLLTITSPVLGKVKADPGQIEQVLLNLIVNARDAMPKGGKLTIETRNVVLSEDYAQRHATIPGPCVMLAVCDTGQGMEASILQRIFDPFFTTKGSGKGTGLGLATVYGIVKQSGGNIWVYSEVGRGSTFKVYLPRVDEPGEGEEVVGSGSIPQGTELILLVEDEDQVRAILKHILEGQGYHVLAASNGEEALSISRDLKRDIKLMITDVVMPQMSGRQLAERVLALRPHLPILFMSGYTDDAIVRHGLLDEKLNFIQKPFDSASVGRKVREVLDSCN